MSCEETVEGCNRNHLSVLDNNANDDSYQKLINEFDVLRLELSASRFAEVAYRISALSSQMKLYQVEANNTLSMMNGDLLHLEGERERLNKERGVFLSEMSEKYGVDFLDPGFSYDPANGKISLG